MSFAIAVLLLAALLAIVSITADVEPGEPLFPTGDERADFALGLAALAVAFLAGVLL